MSQEIPRNVLDGAGICSQRQDVESNRHVATNTTLLCFHHSWVLFQPEKRMLAWEKWELVNLSQSLE